MSHVGNVPTSALRRPISSQSTCLLALELPLQNRRTLQLYSTCFALNRDYEAYGNSEGLPRTRRAGANSEVNDRSRFEVDLTSKWGNDVDYFGTPIRTERGDLTFRAETKGYTEEVSNDALSISIAVVRKRLNKSLISRVGEDNIELLFNLGASQKQIVYLFAKHFEDINFRPAAPVLLGSLRAFQECGLDRQTFLYVLQKVNKGAATSWFLFQSPAGLRDRLELLQGLVVKRSLESVVRNVPDALTLPPGCIEERVQTLIEVGVKLHNNKVLVSFPALLRREPDTVRATAAALKYTIGPKFSMQGKNPVLMTLKAENIEGRAEAFRSLVGDPVLADSILASCPEILVSKTETVVDTWHNLGNRLGFENLPQLATSYPNILALSWRNLGPTFDYLVDVVKVDDIDLLKNPGLLGFSLHRRLKPRFEFLRANGGLKGLSLISVMKPSRAGFAKRFGAKLSTQIEDRSGEALEKEDMDGGVFRGP